MKKTLLLFLLISSVASAKTTGQPLDQMVAIVNDDVISRTELDHALANTKMQITQEHSTLPPMATLQKQVLDQLINKKIQLQIAHQAGVQVTNTELNAAISRIAQQNNMPVSTLYERINQDGMPTEEYRHEIREQLTLQKLQQQEVASKMTITPDEVANFMRSRAWQSNGTKEYHLQDILIPLSEAPTTDEIMAANQHAHEVVTKLNQGQTIDQLTLNNGPNDKTIQGGDLGWRKLPEIPSAFAEHVVKMRPQSVAGPIQTPNGFHVIRLVEARALDAKQAAISRKMIESQLMQQKFEEAVQNWVSKLRSQAFVKIDA